MYKIFAAILLTNVTSVLSIPIQVQITNLEAQKGNLNIAVFDEKTKGNFPNGAKATFKIVKKVNGSTMTIEFKNNQSKQIAISAFQDLNMDKELNMSWFPVPAPKEPVGFSNNYLPKFGPPKYDDAEITVPPTLIEIRMQRLD